LSAADEAVQMVNTVGKVTATKSTPPGEEARGGAAKSSTPWKKEEIDLE
jgi:hypothetical protein